MGAVAGIALLETRPSKPLPRCAGNPEVLELESPPGGNAGVCAGSTETLGTAAAKTQQSTEFLPGLWVPLLSSSRIPSILHTARDKEW